MPNWEKLAVDPDFLEMWESPEMEKEIRSHEVFLVQYNENVSHKRELYEKGILRGLEIARKFAAKQRDIQRNKEVTDLISESEPMPRRRLAGLRFGGS